MRAGRSGFHRRGVFGSKLAVPIRVAVMMAVAALMAEPVLAAEKDLTNKGEVIVRENCARCHAIGQTGESANAEAPPLRVLSQSYPVESLAESLAEGIMSGHPDMPVFVFKPHDVDAIIAYLESIQVPADAAPSDPTPSAPGESEAMDSKG